MKRFSPSVLLLLGIWSLTLAGCGASGPTVTGVITMDGQPLADAEVEFLPYDRSQQLGAELVQTDSSGRFEIKPHPQKAPLKPGKYSILVSKWVDPKTKQPLKPEDAPMQKMAGTARNLVPPTYSNRQFLSPLSAEIKAGKNDLGNLDVKSK